VDIDLSNQRTKVEAALPTFIAFQDELDKRKIIWDKLGPLKRKKWILHSYGTEGNTLSLADSKDPVMWLAIRTYKYFKNFGVNDE